MSDSPPNHPEPGESPYAALPAFTPVPRRCERHDGWTPQRQKLFIEALADYGSVRAACDAVGLATVGAYRLRRQPGAEEFAAAWEAALACGVKRLEDALMERALNGVEVPVYSYGKLIGTRTVYNDRLGMFILRNRAPHRFAEGKPKALNAVGKMEIKRLEKQWRKKWEEEQRLLDDEEEKETQESIEHLLDTMHNNRLSNMSPAQRERQIAADAQARADKAAGWFPGGSYGEYAEEAAKLLPKFIVEVEAEWPPLPAWAWEEPEVEEVEEENATPALPPPAEEEAEPGAGPEQSRGEPSGPRVRSIKDEGW